MGTATLLLPPRSRFGGQRLDPALAAALGRADRGPPGQPGWHEQMARHFTLVPAHWPMAALTRQADAADAAGATWLRADPAYVRPDISGVRLLAWGEALTLTEDDKAALLPALRPLFGDAGLPIDAPTPSRWYLRLASEATLPRFVAPDDALGGDLFEHMPEGPDARRWRALANEAQVLLHNHPWNAGRVAQGKPPVNSLWFWGAGTLPDHVATPHAWVRSGEAQLHALALAAGKARPLPAGSGLGDGDGLIDLRRQTDLHALQADWLQPALQAVRRGGLRRLVLDFQDGVTFILHRGQRWRLWRKSQARLDA